LEIWRQQFRGRRVDQAEFATLPCLRDLDAPLRQAIVDAWAFMTLPRQPETVRQYEVAGRRLAMRGCLPGDIATPSRRSYDLYRAALRHTVALRLVLGSVTLGRLLAEMAVAPGADEWGELREVWRNEVRRLHQYAALVRICVRQTWSTVRQARERGDAAAIGERPLVAPKDRRSSAKRLGLGRLPKLWQDRLLAELPLGTHPYALAARVTALFGVRPAELCREGVVIELTEEGWLTCTVRCAKVRAGEPPRWRRVTIAVEPGRRAAEEMRDLLHACPGETLAVRIADARKFCDAVRAASRRAFPRHAYVCTPYSLRHQFAADAKAGTILVVEGEHEEGDGGTGDGAEQDDAAEEDNQMADGEVLLAQAGRPTAMSTCDVSCAPSPRYGQRSAAHRQAVAAALGHLAPRSQSHYGTRRQGQGALHLHATMSVNAIPKLPVLASRPVASRPVPALEVSPQPEKEQAGSFRPR
jgi:hypothetical protein